LTEPNANVIPPFETITIGEPPREWPVPLLAPRQNRIVVPKMLKVFQGIAFMLPKDWKPGDNLDAASLASFNLTTELYDDLIDIVWMALTRAHPKLTRDEVLDMPTGTAALVATLPTIMRQTGQLKPAAAGVGEATAESHQTGTS
jgi:hypothetical protein